MRSTEASVAHKYEADGSGLDHCREPIPGRRANSTTVACFITVSTDVMKQATRQCYDVCQYEVILQHRSEHRSEGEMRNEGRHDSMMNRDGGETLRVGPSAWMLEPAGRTLDGLEND